MKFLAVLSAVLALNSFARAELPQCTLSQLPQSTLEPPKCHCPNGWDCICAPSECKCAECKVHKAGIAPDAENAERSCREYGCPAVAFIGVPVRPIRGAVAYRLEAKENPVPRVWANGTILPPDATDAAILKACNPGKVIVRYDKVCDENGCKNVPIYGDAVNALAAPPMGFYQPMSFRGGCSGGG
jgi:hypothetical protein